MKKTTGKKSRDTVPLEGAVYKFDENYQEEVKMI
jgi:hypothetical protein